MEPEGITWEFIVGTLTAQVFNLRRQLEVAHHDNGHLQARVAELEGHLSPPTGGDPISPNGSAEPEPAPSNL